MGRYPIRHLFSLILVDISKDVRDQTNLSKTWLCACCPLISLLPTSHQELSIARMVNPKFHRQAFVSDPCLPGLLGPPAAQLLQLSQTVRLTGSSQALSAPAPAPAPGCPLHPQRASPSLRTHPSVRSPLSSGSTVTLHSLVSSLPTPMELGGYTTVSPCSEGALHTQAPPAEGELKDRRVFLPGRGWRGKGALPLTGPVTTVPHLCLLMAVEAIRPTRVANALSTDSPDPLPWRQGLRLKGGGGTRSF